MDAMLLADLEARFGTDEALGVAIRLDDTDEIVPVADYEKRYSHLGRMERPGGESIFPDGSSAVCCTNYAAQIFRAYPGRVKIVGFANEDNPLSKVAREEIHPGGHDFALLDERYLVDPWIRLVPLEDEQIVFDLSKDSDAAKALDIYGPPACWVQLVEFEQQLAEEARRSFDTVAA